MDLSVIIVSWNVRDLLKKCLSSIFEFTQKLNFEVIVIDNDSSDDSLRMIKREFPQVKLIVNNKNLGFAKANNQGIKRAQGKYILLLNPDTELIDNSLGKMVEFIKSKKCDIIGPKLLNTDRSLQRSCRQFPTLADQLLVQLKFYNLFPHKLKSICDYYMLDFEHDQVEEVDQVMGAAILVRRDVFDKIGLLDEKFWSVFEEVDFCKRAKHAKYKICFYPKAQIIHHKEQSFKQMPNLRKQINFNHSLYYYFEKHKPFWQLFILWLLQPINLLLTWLDVKLKIRKKVGKSKDL